MTDQEESDLVLESSGLPSRLRIYNGATRQKGHEREWLTQRRRETKLGMQGPHTSFHKVIFTQRTLIFLTKVLNHSKLRNSHENMTFTRFPMHFQPFLKGLKCQNPHP